MAEKLDYDALLKKMASATNVKLHSNQLYKRARELDAAAQEVFIDILETFEKHKDDENVQEMIDNFKKAVEALESNKEGEKDG